MSAHYGHTVWEDEDGDRYWLRGHVPVRRAIAAANRYARTECGLSNLADDPAAPLSWVTVRHVWWRPDRSDPSGERWEPCQATSPRSVPLTVVSL